MPSLSPANYLAHKLANVLAQYLELDSFGNTLRVNLLSRAGVHLKDTRVKQDVLHGLWHKAAPAHYRPRPVKISASVGLLSIVVPWVSLRASSVSVDLSAVEVSVEIDDRHSTPEATGGAASEPDRDAVALARTLARTLTAELRARLAEALAPPPGANAAAKPGLAKRVTQSLLWSVGRRCVVRVRDLGATVTVLLTPCEDGGADRAVCRAGLRLLSLAPATAADIKKHGDGAAPPAAAAGDGSAFHKLLLLEGLRVDVGGDPASEKAGRDTLLQPFATAGLVFVSPRARTVDAFVRAPEVAVTVGAGAIRAAAALRLADAALRARAGHARGATRPPVAILDHYRAPRAWWQYAIAAVVATLRARRCASARAPAERWQRVVAQSRARSAYVSECCGVLAAAAFDGTPPQLERLRVLESAHRLDAAQLVLYREVAAARLRRLHPELSLVPDAASLLDTAASGPADAEAGAAEAAAAALAALEEDDAGGDVHDGEHENEAPLAPPPPPPPPPLAATHSSDYISDSSDDEFHDCVTEKAVVISAVTPGLGPGPGPTLGLDAAAVAAHALDDIAETLLGAWTGQLAAADAPRRRRAANDTYAVSARWHVGAVSLAFQDADGAGPSVGLRVADVTGSLADGRTAVRVASVVLEDGSGAAAVAMLALGTPTVAALELTLSSLTREFSEPSTTPTDLSAPCLLDRARTAAALAPPPPPNATDVTLGPVSVSADLINVKPALDWAAGHAAAVGLCPVPVVPLPAHLDAQRLAARAGVCRRSIAALEQAYSTSRARKPDWWKADAAQSPSRRKPTRQSIAPPGGAAATAAAAGFSPPGVLHVRLLGVTADFPGGLTLTIGKAALHSVDAAQLKRLPLTIFTTPEAAGHARESMDKQIVRGAAGYGAVATAHLLVEVGDVQLTVARSGDGAPLGLFVRPLAARALLSNGAAAARGAETHVPLAVSLNVAAVDIVVDLDRLEAAAVAARALTRRLARLAPPPGAASRASSRAPAPQPPPLQPRIEVLAPLRALAASLFIESIRIEGCTGGHSAVTTFSSVHAGVEKTTYDSRLSARLGTLAVCFDGGAPIFATTPAGAMAGAVSHGGAGAARPDSESWTVRQERHHAKMYEMPAGAQQEALREAALRTAGTQRRACALSCSVTNKDARYRFGRGGAKTCLFPLLWDPAVQAMARAQDGRLGSFSERLGGRVGRGAARQLAAGLARENDSHVSVELSAVRVNVDTAVVLTFVEFLQTFTSEARVLIMGSSGGGDGAAKGATLPPPPPPLPEPLRNAPKTGQRTTVHATVASLEVALACRAAPFALLQVAAVSVQGISGNGESRWHVNAHALALDDLTGKSLPRYTSWLSAGPPKNGGANKGEAPGAECLRVAFAARPGRGARLSIQLRRGCVRFVNRFLNEVLMGLNSELFEPLGKLLHSGQDEPLPDGDAAAAEDAAVPPPPPPPPSPAGPGLSWRLELIDTEVVAPRGSHASDALGAKIASLELYKEMRAESWVAETDGEASFYDGSASAAGAGGAAAARNVDRLAVELSGVELFAALEAYVPDGTPLCMDADRVAFGPLVHGGRVVTNGKAVAWDDAADDGGAGGDSGAPAATALPDVRWTCITAGAPGGFPLTIYVDTVPSDSVEGGSKRRVLIRSAPEPGRPPLALNVSMADLAMLLGVYYENMQELPEFFEFSEAVYAEWLPEAPPPRDYPPYDTPKCFSNCRAAVPGFRMELLVALVDADLVFSMDPPRVFGAGVEPPESWWMAYESVKHAEAAAASKTPQRAPFARLQTGPLTVRLSGGVGPDGVMIVAIGANRFDLSDARPHARGDHALALSLQPPKPPAAGAPACPALLHGLDDGGRTYLTKPLTVPVLVSVIKSANWLKVDVALDSPVIALHDLAFIWLLIDHVCGFFTNPDYGAPPEMCEWYPQRYPGVAPPECVERTLRAAAAEDSSRPATSTATTTTTITSTTTTTTTTTHHPSLRYPGMVEGLDVHLCLLRPHVRLIERPVMTQSPAVVVELTESLYFRFRNSPEKRRMEACGSNLAVVMLRRWEPTYGRGVRGVKGDGRGISTIVQGLTFAFDLTKDKLMNHTDLAVQVPMLPAHTQPHGSPGWERTLETVRKPSATVLRCPSRPARDLPAEVTDIIASWEEVLDIVASVSILTGPNPPDGGVDPGVEATWEHHDEDEEEDEFEGTMAVRARVAGLRIFFVDSVLGMHLPAIKLCIADLGCSVEKIPEVDAHKPQSSRPPSLPGTPQTSQRLVFGSDNQYTPSRAGTGTPPLATPSSSVYARRGGGASEASPSASAGAGESGPPMVLALNVAVDLRTFGEYFNTTHRCWEPLFEPFAVRALWENATARGKGLSLCAEAPLHVNVTTAMLDTLSSVKQIASSAGKVLSGAEIAREIEERSARAYLRVEAGEQRGEKYATGATKHVHGAAMSDTERHPFSLKNLTGHPARAFQPPSSNDMNEMLERILGDQTTGEEDVELQYLRHGQRVRLEFAPSTTVVRNMRVQQARINDQEVDGEADATLGASTDMLGAEVLAVQPLGFAWVPALSVKALGKTFYPAVPLVLGTEASAARKGILAMLPWQTRNALKLCSDVRMREGGRQLSVSSVFSVRNCTHHDVYMLFGGVDDSEPPRERAELFRRVVAVGESLHIPLALLHHNAESVVKHGCDERLVLGTLAFSPVAAAVEWKCDLPVSLLHDVVRRTGEDYASVHRNRTAADDGAPTQLKPFSLQSACIGRTGGNDNYDNRLLTCYCIEVRRTAVAGVDPSDSENGEDASSPRRSGSLGYRFNFGEQEQRRHGPVAYELDIYEPFVLENRLPVTGTFRLFKDAPGSSSVRQRPRSHEVVWQGTLAPGESTHIHGIMLTQAALVFEADITNSQAYHKSKRGEQNEWLKTMEQVCIHDPSNLSEPKDHPWGLGTKTDVVLTDRYGQRLTVCLASRLECGGGQLRITVYTPFWMVNTSDYAIQYRQEGQSNLPGGTIPVDDVGPAEAAESPALLAVRRAATAAAHDRAVSGAAGIAELVHAAEDATWERRRLKKRPAALALKEKLSLHEILDHAFMFNFSGQSYLDKLTTKNKLTISIDQSNWSPAFTLETFGVHQVISIAGHRGLLEVGMSISSIRGDFAAYTKLVRFVPRFVVLNRLPAPVRLIQSGSLRNEKYATPLPVQPGKVQQFSLPMPHGDRQLRLQISPSHLWKQSAAFPVDQHGELSMRMPRAKGRSTAAQSQSRRPAMLVVTVPAAECAATGLGLWLETDWSRRQMIVKRVEHGTWLYNNSKVQRGDMLVQINRKAVNVSVNTDGKNRTERSRKFDKTVERIRTALKEDTKVVLRFMTHEERMKHIREHAFAAQEDRKYGYGGAHGGPLSIPMVRDDSSSGSELMVAKAENGQHTFTHDFIQADTEFVDANVEMKAVGATILVVLRELPKDAVPYRICNKTLVHSLFFRQAGCDNVPWVKLAPGETRDYLWDEPARAGEQKRLLVRAAAERSVARRLTPKASSRQLRSSLFGRVKRAWSTSLSCSSASTKGRSELGVRSVKLDELSTRQVIPLPDRLTSMTASIDGDSLMASVQADGPTRVLTVERERHGADDAGLAELRKSIKEKVAQIEEEAHMKDQLEHWLSALTTGLLTEDELALEMGEGGTFDSVHIEQPDQLIVEVVEAKGLLSVDLNGLSDPFVEVSLKLPSKAGGAEPGFVERVASCGCRPGKRVQTRRTYYVPKTLDPEWEDQRFRFDIPAACAAAEQDAPEAAAGPRRRDQTWVYANVYDFEFGQARTFMGQVSIPLSRLVDEGPFDGWYDLTEKRITRTATGGIPSKLVTGQLHLRAQWVHTVGGLLKYRLDNTNARLAELHEIKGKHERVVAMFEAAVPAPRSTGRPPRSGRASAFFQRQSTLGMGMARMHAQVQGGMAKLDSAAVKAAGSLRSFNLFAGPGRSSRNLGASVSDDETSDAESLQSSAVGEGGFEETKDSDGAADAGALGGGHLSFESPSPSAADRVRARARTITLSRRVSLGAAAESSAARKRAVSTTVQRTSASRQRSATGLRAAKLALGTSAAHVAFAKEIARDYEKVHEQAGVLTVKLHRVQHLSMIDKDVVVKLRYGSTAMASAAATAIGSSAEWGAGPGAAGAGAELRLPIDKANTHNAGVNGAEVQLSLFAAAGLEPTELGRMGFMLDDALDRLAAAPGRSRRSWFPFTPVQECTHCEGDFRQPWWLTTPEHKSGDAINQLSVDLELRWTPHVPDAPVAPIVHQPSDIWVYARLQGVSLAAISSEKTEDVLQVTVAGIDVRLAKDADATLLGAVVGWLQIDNQLPSASAPVVLAPRPVKDQPPLLRVSAMRDNQRSKESLVVLEKCSFLLQELDVTIEEDFIRALMSFAAECVGAIKNGEETLRNSGDDADAAGAGSDTDEAEPLSPPSSAAGGDAPPPLLPHTAREKGLIGEDGGEAYHDEGTGELKVYIRKLRLNPIQINITFLRSSESAVISIHSVASAREAMTRFGGPALYTVVRLMTDLVMDIATSVSDAPIKLNGLLIDDVHKSPAQLSKMLQRHYLDAFVRQLYKIFASLNFLGNPISLADSLGAGVKDFFEQPAQGLLEGTATMEGVAVGLASGTLSLVTHTTSGVLDSVHTLTSAIAQSVANLTMDPRYLRLREQRNEKDRHRSPCRQPAMDVLYGLAQGVGGVFLDPYDGARRGGCMGLAKGVVLGAVGAVVKPAVGVIDAAAHIVAAVSGACSDVALLTKHERRLEPVQRCRIAHFFGLDGRLLPFNAQLGLASVAVRELGGRDGRGGSVLGLVRGFIDDRYSDGTAPSDDRVIWAETLPQREDVGKQAPSWAVRDGDQTMLIVSMARIMCLRVRRGGSVIERELIWSVPYADGSELLPIFEHDPWGGGTLAIGTQVAKAATIERVDSTDGSAAVPGTAPGTAPGGRTSGGEGGGGGGGGREHTGSNPVALGERGLAALTGAFAPVIELGHNVTELGQGVARDIKALTRTAAKASKVSAHVDAQGRYLLAGTYRDTDALLRAHSALCCRLGCLATDPQVRRARFGMVRATGDGDHDHGQEASGRTSRGIFGDALRTFGSWEFDPSEVVSFAQAFDGLPGSDAGAKIVLTKQQKAAFAAMWFGHLRAAKGTKAVLAGEETLLHRLMVGSIAAHALAASQGGAARTIQRCARNRKRRSRSRRNCSVEMEPVFVEHGTMDDDEAKGGEEVRPRSNSLVSYGKGMVSKILPTFGGDRGKPKATELEVLGRKKSLTPGEALRLKGLMQQGVAERKEAGGAEGAGSLEAEMHQLGRRKSLAPEEAQRLKELMVMQAPSAVRGSAGEAAEQGGGEAAEQEVAQGGGAKPRLSAEANHPGLSAEANPGLSAEANPGLLASASAVSLASSGAEEVSRINAPEVLGADVSGTDASPASPPSPAATDVSSYGRTPVPSVPDYRTPVPDFEASASPGGDVATPMMMEMVGRLNRVENMLLALTPQSAGHMAYSPATSTRSVDDMYEIERLKTLVETLSAKLDRRRGGLREDDAGPAGALESKLCEVGDETDGVDGNGDGDGDGDADGDGDGDGDGVADVVVREEENRDGVLEEGRPLVALADEAEAPPLTDDAAPTGL